MSAYVVFYVFFAAGVIRAVAQRLPHRTLVVAAPVAIALPTPLHVTPDEAAARARALFEADDIGVEEYEAELDRLIVEGARLR